jgi:hypothetical protein
MRPFRFSSLALALAAAMAFGATITTSAEAQMQPSGGNGGLTLTFDTNAGNFLTGANSNSTFHMSFLLDDPLRMSNTALGTTHDLEISLTSPNNSVFRFMFSPRPQFGIGFDPISGTNRAYGGLTWNLFSENSLFGNLGLASSFDPGLGGPAGRRLDEAPLMFHSAFELGYRLDTENSLMFAIDQGVAPGLHGAGAEPDNFILQYGTKF